MSRWRTAGLNSITGQHGFYQGSTLDTIMGAPNPTTVEINLGWPAKFSGTFDIPASNLNTARTVVIQQASGPYTNKGTLQDEAEMDQVKVTGYILDDSTIRCYWNGGTSAMVGNIKFIQQVITSQ